MKFLTPYDTGFAQDHRPKWRNAIAPQLWRPQVLEHPCGETTKEVVDPYDVDEDKRKKSIKDLEEITIDIINTTKVRMIGQGLTGEFKDHLIAFLKK